MLLVSDGVTTGKDDRWVRKLLSEFDGLSPQALAAQVLGGADERAGRITSRPFLPSSEAVPIASAPSFAQIDLFSGKSAVYKLGAAPTYLRRGGVVERLCGESLPAGVAAGELSAPDAFPLSLDAGDCVLLVSDGVTTGKDDRSGPAPPGGTSPAAAGRFRCPPGPPRRCPCRRTAGSSGRRRSSARSRRWTCAASAW